MIKVMITDKNHCPARLYAFLARDNPHQGLILRRGPSEQLACIGWNRKNDSFKLGQWLKGIIYVSACDLSPNGKYFLYGARNSSCTERWTAVSETPYLTALDFSFNEQRVYGGGLFLSNSAYWFDTKLDQTAFKFKHSPLTPIDKHPDIPYRTWWDDYRLQRDGWQSITSTQDNIYSFFKVLNKEWQLIKSMNSSKWNAPRILGRGNHYETHRLVNIQNGQEIDCPDWEWADLDRERIVFAKKGKLCALPFTQNTLDMNAIKVLHDFTPMVFEEVKAPYAKA